jgi:hypothetical protein
MAMNAALGTAELLASILQELDFKTLLLAQRVSQQWRTVIQSSPELQEKLFYIHRPKPCEDKRYIWTPSDPHCQLREHQDKSDNASPPALTNKNTLAPIKFHPLLIEEILPLDYKVAEGSDVAEGQWAMTIAISDLFEDEEGSWQGSWQSMLLSHPPATKVFARPAHGGYRFTVEDPSGVKMLQVVEEVVRTTTKSGRYPRGYISGTTLDNWQLMFPGSVDPAYPEGVER